MKNYEICIEVNEDMYFENLSIPENVEVQDCVDRIFKAKLYKMERTLEGNKYLIFIPVDKITLVKLKELD